MIQDTKIKSKDKAKMAFKRVKYKCSSGKIGLTFLHSVCCNLFWHTEEALGLYFYELPDTLKCSFRNLGKDLVYKQSLHGTNAAKVINKSNIFNNNVAYARLALDEVFE